MRQLLYRAAEAVKPPDDKGVSCSQVFEAFGEARAVHLGAAYRVGKEPSATCLLKGVLLKV